jgi:preprotein translocase subunit SecA
MGPIYQLLGLSVGVLFTSQSPLFEYGILMDDGHTLRVMPKGPLNSQSRVSQDSTQTSSSEIQELPAAQSLEYEAGRNAATASEIVHETTMEYVADVGLIEKEVYTRDIIYGQLQSFAFRYLRDNLAIRVEDQIPVHNDAIIIDECDSVLIDDLEIPYDIAKARSSNVPKLSVSGLQYMHSLAETLVPGKDFTLEPLSITFSGVKRIQSITGIDYFTDEACSLANALINALQARFVYNKDDDYSIKGEEIVIIDDKSGRFLYGRKYSEGLHEALAIKEGLPVDSADIAKVTVAKISCRNFCLVYSALSGMSGVIGSPKDYLTFYQLQSVQISPYPLSRTDLPDRIFRTRDEVEKDAVSLAVSASNRGQPVLINVPKLADVDSICKILDRADVQYQALDARSVQNLGEEAEKILLAGKPGQITVCSKLAARGTDILLSAESKKAGGLFVIGIQRGEDRRHDDQLRGRAGRHGDPGLSVFLDSLQDDLMKVLAVDRLAGLMSRIGMEEGEPIEHSLISRAVQNAQRRLQDDRRQWRARAVELNDILARHILIFYELRQKIFVKPDLMPEIMTMLGNWVFYVIQTSLSKLQYGLPSLSLSECVFGRLDTILDRVELDRILQIKGQNRMSNALHELMERKIQRKLSAFHGRLANDLMRYLALSSMDNHWSKYLEFERYLWNETLLYGYSTSAMSSKYVSAMEERFDAFFYEVGESILFNLLTVEVATSQTAVSSEDNNE